MILDRRSEAEEWMDAADAGEPAFAAALRDLGRINRMTLAARPVLDFLDRLVAETGTRSLSVLDVGCGGGDMLFEIDRWAVKRGIAVTLTGLDRSPWAARYATAQGVRARFITADLFELDPTERFDVIICSLFTHHLKNPEVVRFFRWLEQRATRGWLVSDLHRHWLPWVALWAGFRLMRLDPMVIHDSTVSVARSFVRADWLRLLEEADVEAQVRWEFPFRWTVSVLRR